MEAVGRLAGRRGPRLQQSPDGHQRLRRNGARPADARAAGAGHGPGNGEGKRTGPRRSPAQLLAFSRQQVMTPSVLDLNAIVTEMPADAPSALLGKDIRLSTILQPNLWPVHADRGQLETGHHELGGERPATPCRVEASSPSSRRNRELDHGYTQIAPRSQTRGVWSCWRSATPGTGWRRRRRAHIFEPFFTTKETGQGTGARPGNGAWHREAECREHRAVQRTGAWHGLQDLFAALFRDSAAGRPAGPLSPKKFKGGAENGALGRGRRGAPGSSAVASCKRRAMRCWKHVRAWRPSAWWSSTTDPFIS